MPDDTIYMTPLPANEGTIYMEPLAALTGVIYMQKDETAILDEWILIGVYAFPGNQATTTWSYSDIGVWTGLAGSITTTYSSVKILPRSGWWLQGESGLYRGVLDIKSSVDYSAVGNDWNGVNYGFSSGSEAAVYWMTTYAEISVGGDGTFAWGAYDATGGGDNSGMLTFYLFGKDS
jgi:hypothetical protein